MGAIAARIDSLATDAAAIAAIMAITAPSSRVSMRSWLHTPYEGACDASASRPNECEVEANFHEALARATFRRTPMNLNRRPTGSYSARLASPPQ